MPYKSLKLLAVFLLSTVFIVKTSWADTLKVLTTGAFKQVVVAVAADFQKQTGHRVEIQNDTAGGISRRVAAGEYFDVVVLPPAALNTFASSGLLENDSIISLAKVAIGVAIKEGAPLPVLETVEDFKRIIHNARKVAVINPASGGSSGIYLEGLFQRIGLVDEMKSKAILVNGGLVAEKLVTGEADVAIHQISEILPVTGAVLIGPLPESIQNYTTYAAALRAHSEKSGIASAFLKSFKSAQSSAIIRDKGMTALHTNP